MKRKRRADDHFGRGNLSLKRIPTFPQAKHTAIENSMQKSQVRLGNDCVLELLKENHQLLFKENGSFEEWVWPKCQKCCLFILRYHLSQNKLKASTFHYTTNKSSIVAVVRLSTIGFIPYKHSNSSTTQINCP